jgi:hypothetical protein
LISITAPGSIAQRQPPVADVANVIRNGPAVVVEREPLGSRD